MFTFSEKHAWQGDVAVQQILVFPSSEEKHEFNKSYAQRLSTTFVENCSDTGIGAVYKLRSVLDNHGKFVPVIRCGVTGKQLWVSYDTQATPEAALKKCLENLQELLNFDSININS